MVLLTETGNTGKQVWVRSRMLDSLGTGEIEFTFGRVEVT